MTEFIWEQIIFFFSLALVSFIPGYLMLAAFFGRSEKHLNKLEKFVFSFGVGIVASNFIMLFISKIGIPLSAPAIVSSLIIFSGINWIIYKIYHSKKKYSSEPNSLFDFSKKQMFAIAIILFLSFFMRVSYLEDTVGPDSTDMGHHLYWVKTISETGKLTDYDQMPDFIIGEHLTLSAIAIITKADIFGSFPIVFLFGVNIFGIMTLFILTLRIFKNKKVAIYCLFFLGALFATASPQAKFISGGVIGNILGNLLMPLAIYFIFRSFEFWEKTDFFKNILSSQKFLSLAIFVSAGLFYTHHLTAFIFLFVLIFWGIIFTVINYSKFLKMARTFGKIFFSPWALGALIFSLIFVFFIYTPTYFSQSAVETAVGAPSKSTRVGLTISEIKSSTGEARLALGLLGLLMVIAAIRKEKTSVGLTISASWLIMLFLMSYKPQFLFINLPSARIGNYLVYPLSILSAFGLGAVFSRESIFSNQLIKKAFLVLMAFIMISGILDSAQSFKRSADFSSTLETFGAAKYLSKNTTSEDIILKDHNYLTGDTWMKLFFMRGYTYPLSRSLFKRYEDETKPREMCTLQMISSPSGAPAQKCFSETGVNFIALNPRYDSSQFKKDSDFNQVYSGENVAVYYKK